MHAEVVQWHWCQTLKDEINMATRHRIPSIFNLSMVDVLCCALGCVILLWLINLRSAKEHEDTAATKLTQATQMAQNLTADRDRFRAEGEKYRDERDAAYQREKALKGQLDDAEALGRRLARELEEERQAAARLRKELDGLAGQLKSTQDTLTTARGELKDSQGQYRAALARAEELDRKIKEADERARQLRALADMLPRLQEDLKDAQGQAARERDRVAERERLLTEAEKKMQAQQTGATKKQQELEEENARYRLSLALRDKELKDARERADKLGQDLDGLKAAGQ